MIIEQTYNFSYEDYDRDGFNKSNGKLFTEFIRECENDFHKYNIIFIANFFFANSFTMRLIKRCHLDDENEDYGMDLIDGDIDLDINLEIEKYSNRKTVYGINSSVDGNEEEPLWLIINDTIRDGVFILKYDSENDDDDDIEIDLPVDSNLIKVSK